MKNNQIIEIIKNLEKSEFHGTLTLKFVDGIVVGGKEEKQLDLPKE